MGLRLSSVYKRHTTWRMVSIIDRRDVTLSVDNSIFDIGSLLAEKNPMGAPKYTITDEMLRYTGGVRWSSEECEGVARSVS